jgi:hypothetical protein
MSSQAKFLVAAMAVYLLLGLGFCLDSAPLGDEAYIANPSFNLATRGVLGTSLFSRRDVAAAVGCFSVEDCLAHNRLAKKHQESYFQMDRYTYWVLPTYLVLQAAWYKLVGFGLMQTRLIPLFSGVILIWACYAIVGALFPSTKAAIFTAALLAIDMTVLAMAAFGRMDMFCAAMGYLGIALYVRGRQSDMNRAVFWAHSCAAVACLTNPNGALAALGLVVLICYLDLRRVRFRHVLLTGIPYVAGIAAWGIYIAKSPTTFLSQFLGNASGRGAGLAAPLQAVRFEVFYRYAPRFGFAPDTSGFARIKIIVLAIFMLGVAAAIYLSIAEWKREQQALLVLFGLYAFVLTFGEGMKFQFYLIHIVPLYICLCAVVAAHALRAGAPAWQRAAAAICLTAFVGVSLVTWASRMWSNPYAREFSPMAKYLSPQLEHTQNAICAPGIALGLGFPGNCPFDTGLGLTGTTPHPDVIAMNDEWARNFEDSRDVASEWYTTISNSLKNEYQLGYDSKRYKVYRRAANVGPIR